MHEAVQLMILAQWLRQMYLIVGTEQIFLTHVLLCKPNHLSAVFCSQHAISDALFCCASKTSAPTWHMIHKMTGCFMFCLFEQHQQCSRHGGYQFLHIFMTSER